MIVVANHFNQDSVAEAIVVKRLIKESLIDIQLERAHTHREIRGSFELNPGPCIINLYNKKIKKSEKIWILKIEILI